MSIIKKLFCPHEWALKRTIHGDAALHARSEWECVNCGSNHFSQFINKPSKGKISAASPLPLVDALDLLPGNLMCRDEQLLSCVSRRDVIDLVNAFSMPQTKPIAWFTDDYKTDPSATTYAPDVAERWKNKGWAVYELYAAKNNQGMLLSPHIYRDLVNELAESARTYAAAGQLRARISAVLKLHGITPNHTQHVNGAKVDEKTF